ncbi:hypothetical protein HCN44_008700 [Aphidius gifuensis]|uniref:Uncharacterized protein n=1 Tax=Aphidius gifuensis TaxID=684658 RepID=A0A834XNN1_APHGI|nr:hypothetical protein HCN44_008700 [Aphidius gifuensis]
MKKELLAHQGDLGIIDREINDERKEFINLIFNYKKRLAVSRKLLEEKSDELAKLKADYQFINNSCCILEKKIQKIEDNYAQTLSSILKNFYELQEKLKTTEDDYKRVSNDFEKSQKMLIDASTREIDLQQSIAKAELNPEKDSKINKLENKIVDLHLALEEMQGKLGLKQKCHCYKSQLLSLRKRITVLQKQSKDLIKLKDLLAQNCENFNQCNCSYSNINNKNRRRDKEIFKKCRVQASENRNLKAKKIKSIARKICQKNNMMNTVPIKKYITSSRLNIDENRDFGYQSSNSK